MSRSLRNVVIRSLALSLVSLVLVPGARSWADESGVSLTGSRGIRMTTAQISALPPRSDAAEVSRLRLTREIEGPERDDLPQAPGAHDQARWPAPGIAAPDASARPPGNVPFSPQTLGITFNGASLNDTGAFPPDVMGAIGPSQFLVFVNGRIRSFDKSTGLADGVLNVDSDVFFSSVMTPVGGTVVINFTSDPQIRYDRLSSRWFLTIIDVPCANGSCSSLNPNRLLIAVSDAASGGTITPSTVWTFFQFTADAAQFLDYPSLGVDANALYIGGNMFNTGGTSFLGTKGWVVPKSSVLGAGPVSVTKFTFAPTGSSEGPVAPRGVDNFDPTSNEGYFIGASNIAFGRLVARRVNNPGGVPTVSGDLLITVNTTSNPIPVAHLGNTNGNNGRLDALDDRLFAAHIRNGRLWTAHNIAVTSAGVASGGDAQRRNGVRWYELDGIRSTDNGGVPVVVQSGTIFDPAATLAGARQYWIPSVMVSGQGHAAFGFSTAGTSFRADAGTTGRLVSDPFGTTETNLQYTSSSTAYNPPSDPGGFGGRRWGDYSLTTLDPLDDMTMWTVQEFCNSTNSYGCQVVKLIAPPPALPATVPAVDAGQASAVVTLEGTSSGGSGFFDPGADLPSPALPFTHLSVSILGFNPPTVNSATYVDPTHVQLDLNTSTTNPGSYDVTITNPDGQAATGTGILVVNATTAVASDAPHGFALQSIEPNPTTGRTEIAFSVDHETKVRLSIVDLQGREVAVLENGVKAAGRYVVSWNGQRGGRAAAAGVYFVRYRAAGHEDIRRLALTP
jgi:hypothetical protein